MVEQEFMTVKELEKYTRIDEKTIYKMAERGEIPHYRLSLKGRLIRFKKAEIDQWLTEKAVGSKELVKEDENEYEKTARGLIIKHRETAASQKEGGSYAV